MKVRVGFEKFEPRDLGFENYYSLRLTESDYKPIFLHYLERHREPLVVLSHNADVYIDDFNHAITRYLDYPTLPFIRILRILESQQERFLEEVEFAIAKRTFICCSAIAYVHDIAALLKFALSRRDVDINLEFKCEWPVLTKAMVRRIEDALAEAEQPAPSLGNLVYVDIADRAWQLLRGAIGILKLVPVKNGCTNICENRSAELILF